MAQGKKIIRPGATVGGEGVKLHEAILKWPIYIVFHKDKVNSKRANGVVMTCLGVVPHPKRGLVRVFVFNGDETQFEASHKAQRGLHTTAHTFRLLWHFFKKCHLSGRNSVGS